MKDLLIRRGRVVDPASRLDGERDVLVRDGKLAGIDKPGTIKAAKADVVDAKGLVVAPGLIDIHVHLREPGQGYKETIATGTAAAAEAPLAGRARLAAAGMAGAKTAKAAGAAARNDATMSRSVKRRASSALASACS